MTNDLYIDLDYSLSRIRECVANGNLHGAAYAHGMYSGICAALFDLGHISNAEYDARTRTAMDARLEDRR